MLPCLILSVTSTSLRLAQLTKPENFRSCPATIYQRERHESLRGHASACQQISFIQRGGRYVALVWSRKIHLQKEVFRTGLALQAFSLRREQPLYVQKLDTMSELVRRRPGFSFAVKPFDDSLQTDFIGTSFLKATVRSTFPNKMKLFVCNAGPSKARNESFFRRTKRR